MMQNSQMWVSSLWINLMGHWVGKWLGHLATHAITMREILQLVVVIKNALKPNEG